MDYEKKYNEALERAKAYHRNELAGSRKEMTEYIFPELRESEDERIRKKLYHTVMGTPNDSTWFDGTSKEAMLAWLEKQKEQKPAEWSEEDENTIELMIAILRENHPNGLFKTNPVNTTCMSAISTDMLIKRIESLRPSWKHSDQDELMKLKYAGTSTKLD